MESICVFCGSSAGNDPEYKKVAYDLGKKIARENFQLIYGGGSIGLMGIMADSVLEHGGQVTGVIPQFLYDLEVGHDGVTELLIVDSMHERKQKMATLAQGFVAMPGGIGTMEELFEIFTWSQLSLIKKPVALLNIQGFYDDLIRFIDHMVASGFLHKGTRDQLIKSSDINALIDTMKNYKYSEYSKIDKT
jgi:uncharacterized protein (TIGR00730 family)